jgi:hypothetical protein
LQAWRFWFRRPGWWRRMPNKCLQPLLRRKPMPPHRWLLPNLMPNSEEPVAMRAGALPEGALPTVGWSILLAPVRRPTISSAPPVQANLGNGTGLPAQTGAATCASRTSTPCAGTDTKRRVKNERRLLLIFSPAPAGLFFAARHGIAAKFFRSRRWRLARRDL